MKQVLIIANLAHASPRVPGFATYLSEYGWEPTIITPHIITQSFPTQFSKRVKIVEAPYCGDIFWLWRKVLRGLGFKEQNSLTEQIKYRMGINKKKSFPDILINWYQTIFAYPDTEITWRKPALKAAFKLLTAQHYDAVLSSSPFPTSHCIAAQIKAKTNLPWLADFRDLWTQNHNYPFSSIRKYFESKFEIKLLRSANAMTTVVTTLAEKQSLLHHKPIMVIENGFDPGNINEPAVNLTNEFTITYTGTIYTGKQDPEALFKALERVIPKLQLKPGDINIRFYGTKQRWIEESINKYNLEQYVHQYGTVSRNESLQKQRDSHILLLLNWEDPSEIGIYPSTKLFEYFTARRPIMATGGFHGAILESIFLETNSGIYVSSVEEIENALVNFYQEYKHTGKISYNGDNEKTKGYSYREAARKFSDTLNGIIK